MDIVLKIIGTVHSTRTEMVDDHWEDEQAYIELLKEFSHESLMGLEDFSHVEIAFYMNQVDHNKIETNARHPRNNLDWPKVGIFAQRGKNRPNQIGLTICEVIKVESNRLYVRALDAIDGTPVLDIKPVMQEFLPRTKVFQPEWSSELMADYWRAKS